MISIGRRVSIRPAYNSETGERDIWDEIAGMEGRVVRHARDGEHVVEIGGEEHWVHVGRLRERSPEA